MTGFWTVSKERFVEDALVDDQAFVASVEGKGLVIFTGCAHAGVINTIWQSRRVMGIDKVYAVIGGFHLANADDERLRLTVKDLLDTGPEFVHLCHCTGEKALKVLKKAFGSRCEPALTGDVIAF